MISRLFTGIAAVAFALFTTQTAQAQSAFSPAIIVNDRVVTYYEIEQRALLLAIMNTPGDVRKLAREQLIEDRLKLEAAEIAGITPSEDGIQAGIAEFAQRVNMPPEDMIKALAAEGVDEETMRAFTFSGLAWRGVIQTRFGSRVQITEEEIDRAIASNSGAGGIRVLLSEIVIPATPQTREQVTSLATQLSQIRSFADFENAARTYSGAPTKQDGGKIDWMSITNLPPQLRPLISALGPGEVTDPVQLPNAVAIFQMRGIEETGRRAPSYSAIDYAMLYIPGGRTPETLARAQEIRDTIDRCDDLYGLAKGQPAGTLVREAQAPGKIPRDIALELAKLDDNEVSTALTTANRQSLIFLMLCGRTAQLGEELSREDVAGALRQQRLQSFADSYLEQLRADAIIVEK
ncbi:peptidylprolyl isomerase [Shimia aestuarii]|uniref:Parvulin-like PPIase n=1 Tax=Shimia aestuarii TaxID=254406 RepID=A0A1I4NLJ0_9RHOB|nr:peptidylprolyl isomerase [Shimia aestuarii]SFM16321.1 periplasmic chaperone for outer membrane proteins SurA [Shimia aestuarii]